MVDGLALDLQAGRHLVRIEMLAGNTNLDRVEFRLITSTNCRVRRKGNE